MDPNQIKPLNLERLKHLFANDWNYQILVNALREASRNGTAVIMDGQLVA